MSSPEDIPRPPPPPGPPLRRIPESALGKRVRERYGSSTSDCDDPDCVDRYSNEFARREKEYDMDKLIKILQDLVKNQEIMDTNMQTMDDRIAELEKDLASDQTTMYRSSPRPKTVADLAGNKES